MDAKIIFEPHEQSVGLLHFTNLKRECTLTISTCMNLADRDTSTTGIEVRADNLIFEREVRLVSVNHAEICFKDGKVSYKLICHDLTVGGGGGGGGSCMDTDWDL